MALFRHLRVRTFKVDQFEFKDHTLRLEEGDDLDKFRRIVNDPRFPAMHRHAIVEYPDNADAYAPKPVAAQSSRVVRDEMVTGDIKSEAVEQPMPEGKGSNVARDSLKSTDSKSPKFA